jgi:hypothetical protein
MAAVTGTITSVSGFTTPDGRSATSDSPAQDVLCCDIFVNFAGTYATFSSPTTDGFSIAGVTTAIQNARRNGKTVLLVSACGGQPGYDSTTPMGACGCVVPWQGATAGYITGQLTTGTLLAEHGAALLVAGAKPVQIRVTFKEV